MDMAASEPMHQPNIGPVCIAELVIIAVAADRIGSF